MPAQSQPSARSRLLRTLSFTSSLAPNLDKIFARFFVAKVDEFLQDAALLWLREVEGPEVHRHRFLEEIETAEAVGEAGLLIGRQADQAVDTSTAVKREREFGRASFSFWCQQIADAAESAAARGRRVLAWLMQRQVGPARWGI